MPPADNPATQSPNGPSGLALVEANARLRQSEARYRTLVESIDEGLGIIERMDTAPGDPVNFRCLAANSVFSRQSGFDDVVGMTMRDVLPGEQEEWFAVYDRVARTGAPIRFERDLETIGQTLEVYAFPVNGPSSGRLGIIFKNVTERKHHDAERERLLREVETERARLADIFEHAPSMMIIYRGPDHVVEQANTSYRQWAGDRDVIGKQIAEVFPELIGQGPIEALDQVYATGEPQAVTGARVVVDQGDGRQEEHYVDFVLRALREADGRISGVFGQGVLQTERERAERALRQTAERDAFLVTLTDTLRSLADPETIQAEACRLLGDHLGVDRTYYVEVNEPEGYVRVYPDYLRGESPSLAGVMPLAAYGWVVPHLARNETVVVTDTQWAAIVPDADRAAMAAVQIAAHVTVPLVRAGALVGAFCVTEAAPREWQTAEIELVRETAIRISTSIERARAEEATRHSESRYRSLFEAMDQGFCIIERVATAAGEPPDFRYLTANPAFERHTGLYAPVNKTIQQLVPEANPSVLKRYDRVLRTGQAERFEAYITALDLWIEADVYPAQEPGQLAVLFSNVSFRKRAEETLRESEKRQAFLLRISDAIRPLADPAEIQATASHLLGEHLGVDRVFYAEVEIDGDTDYFRIERTYHTPGTLNIAGRYPVASFGRTVGDTYRAGRSMAVADVETDGALTGSDRIAFAAVDVGAFIGVPLIKDGRFVAAFGVNQRLARTWLPADVSLVEEVADRTWAAVAQSQAEMALRESETRYRSLFESIDQGFCIIEKVATVPGASSDYRYVAANPAFERHTGIPAPVGRTIRELVPDAEPSTMDRYDRVVATGEAQRFEVHVSALDVWLDIEANPAMEPGHVAVLFTNITARKRAEANLTFLNDVSQDLAQLTSIDEAMDTLGAKLAAYLGLSACAFAELQDSAHIGVINHDWHRADMPSLVGTYRMEEFVSPEVLRRCRAGEAVVIRDVFADPLTGGEQYAALNIGSFVSMPLVRGDEWRFLLVVYRSETSNWRDDEIDLVRELTMRVWTRLERARAEAALRENDERQAFLLRLSDALRPLVDPEDIQATAARVVGEWLNADRSYYATVEPDHAHIVIPPGHFMKPGTINIAGRYPMTSFAGVIIDTLNANREIVIVDTQADPRLTERERIAHATIDVRAYAAVPLVKSGRLVGAFGALMSSPRDWTAEEIGVIRETAERTWEAVERARTEAALRESETRYRTLFESIDQGFCTIEVIFDEHDEPVDYVFLEINPAFARNTGLADALGKRMRDLRPDHEQFWFDLYGRVALTGKGERVEHEAATLGRWYSVYAYRIGEPGQRRVAILFEDITVRRQADLALRESRAEIERQAQFLNATLSNIGDYISIWDRNGRFTYANRALERLWDRKPRHYVGKRPAELGYPPEHVTFFSEAIARVFRTKQRLTGELPYTDTDGVDGIYEVVFSPVTGLGPRPEFVVGVSRDISAQKRREARAAFLADVGDDFARLTTPDEIMRVVGDKIYEHFGLDRLAFAYVDEEADTVTSIHDRHAQGLPVPEPVIRLSDFVSTAWRRRLHTGQVYAVHDIDSDPYAAGHVDAFKGLDVGALLLAPFVSEGAWRFVIVLQKTAPYRWQEADIDLVQDLAPRLYLAIERARAGAVIRESETRFRTVANLVPDPIWSMDSSGRTTWCSQRLFDYTGLTGDDMKGDGWLQIIHEDDREGSIRGFQEAVAAGRPFHREHRLRRHDGTHRWFVVRAVPIRDESGQVVQWFGTATDIHDARLAREELTRQVALATTDLRSLSRQLLTVQEEERRHLARELHDEIGQALTALNLQLAAARRTPARLAEAEAIVHDLTDRVSELSMDLRPSVLDNLGLIPALLWYSQRYESRTSVRVDLRHHGFDRRLSPAVEICAYRIVQEALTNVARHAGVDLVSVQLLADDRLTVVVRDKGRGFDAAATPATGGLGGMRERVQLLDGNLWIDATDGSGVMVTAEIPLDPDDSTRADETS